MRQTHVGGDKLFVDYAGDTVPVIVDRLTGEVRRSGRTKNWLKFKNPDAPAVKREAEEDWGKKRWRA
jgi:hypothetical protein